MRHVQCAGHRCLIDAGLSDIRRVDTNLTRLILSRNVPLWVLGNLMDHVLFNEEPSALRSDFSGSLDAMSQSGLLRMQALLLVSNRAKAARSGIPEVVNLSLVTKPGP